MTTIQETQVRLATPSDADQLLALNHRWQKESLGNNLEQGYLSLALEKDVLDQIIANKAIVIAVVGEEVVAYVLSNNYSKIIEKYSGKRVKELKQAGKINADLNIALGAQVVIEVAYRKKGLRRLMLRKLLESLSKNYDALFTSVALENEWILKMDLRDGWELVAQDKKHYYIILMIKKWLTNQK